jgi:hypothetical protein
MIPYLCICTNAYFINIVVLVDTSNLFYLYAYAYINEKNVKLSKGLMTAGRKHKTNVVIGILIKSCFDDVNE